MDHRTKVEFKIEAEGAEVPGPIHSFQLIRTEDHQIRRSDREHWRSDTDKIKWEVIADGITRRQMVKIIEDAADWLAYIEGETL
jgi:hypothetical protein